MLPESVLSMATLSWPYRSYTTSRHPWQGLAKKVIGRKPLWRIRVWCGLKINENPQSPHPRPDSIFKGPREPILRLFDLWSLLRSPASGRGEIVKAILFCFLSPILGEGSRVRAVRCLV
jgi:hypothetical protein